MTETTREQRRLKNLERLKSLRLLDDEFMTKCFEDAPECVELVLRIILDKQDLQVTEAKTQVFVANLLKRSVRLDVLATDSQGRRYNIEIQRASGGAGYRRARYNSSMLDLNLLQKGEDFDSLPETYVIFITENDAVGGGLPLYRIERCNLDCREIIDDGEHMIYVNGAYRDDTALGRLMQDFASAEPADMFYDVLADRVRFFKESEEGSGIMSDIMEQMWNEAVNEGIQKGMSEGIQKGMSEGIQKGLSEGIQKGISEANRESALRMLAAGTLTLEQIAEFSGLPLEEVKRLQKERTA